MCAILLHPYIEFSAVLKLLSLPRPNSFCMAASSKAAEGAEHIGNMHLNCLTPESFSNPAELGCDLTSDFDY